MSFVEGIFFALGIAAILFGWIGSIVHAARLGRGWMAVLLFFLHGLWIFWWPLHEKVPGRCSSVR